MAELSPCALILLAAGASRRMGRPKQLLPIDGIPLLRRAAEAGVAAGVDTVIVVLGAKADEIRACLTGLPVHVVVNPDWEEGMGSSVRTGMQALDAVRPSAENVIVALADQPGFSARQVRALFETHQRTGQSLVASKWQGKLSPPVFFGAIHFPELRLLAGDAGARIVLQTHAQELAVVDADDLADLDTPEDYEAFLRRWGRR